MEYQSRYLTPFQRKQLLKLLESDLRLEYRRRLEIMLRADMGQPQAQICAELNCSQQTARYWISVARSGDAHHWLQQPIGRPRTVSEEYCEHLKELISRSPREYGYSFQRWTAQWLKKHLAKELGIEISERHINRILQKMGFSTRRKKQEPVNTPNYEDLKLKIEDLSLSSVSNIYISPINFPNISH